MHTSTLSPTRNVDLDHLARLLQDQQARKVDVVAGHGAIRAVGGSLVIDGTEPQLGPDGVTMTSGTYAVNDVAVQGIAEKLGIPVAYLRKLSAEHVDLFDDNVNGWLSRTDRRFLVRCLRGESGGGVARAFLSDTYKRIDNFDVLLAVLDGVKTAGVHVEVDGCDLTDRRMHVRVYSPEVQALAPKLLAGYRSPFDGRSGADLPVVWGGFQISNSETGCGAFTLTPRLTMQVCRNGLLRTEDAMRSVHRAVRLDEGVIDWSAETLAKTLDLITATTRDAVRTFLDPAYVNRALRELENVAAAPVEDPDTTIKVVGQRMRFTEEQSRTILAHFIKGGDLTAGGILHAVTSAAQTVADADTAYEMEAAAVPAMRIAAAL